jgi:chloride channel 7
MSNDVRILLPAMVAIMLAKFVADAATHSLYHGLLEVKCVPFLPKDVSGVVSLTGLHSTVLRRTAHEWAGCIGWAAMRGLL